jgi:hypothetical protein
MSNADDMLEWADARARELAVPGLDPRPRRNVAVLTCMDARIDVFAMLGLARGDAHIVRNAGGLVTDDTLRSLSVSQRLLGALGVSYRPRQALHQLRGGVVGGEMYRVDALFQQHGCIRVLVLVGRDDDPGHEISLVEVR